jgi:aspartate/methionine/tyrosine aminotransferase
MTEIEPFRVVEVLTRATELAAAGRDIVHLAAGHLRFSYTTGMDRLEQAVERLAGVLG